MQKLEYEVVAGDEAPVELPSLQKALLPESEKLDADWPVDRLAEIMGTVRQELLCNADSAGLVRSLPYGVSSPFVYNFGDLLDRSSAS